MTCTTTRTTRRSCVMAGVVWLLTGMPAPAQIQRTADTPHPLVKENTTVKVSPHVYVIPDGFVGAVPNVGIIVGSKATLVIDTGMGRRNGETVLREVRKVSSNRDLFLVATHFHTEHFGGSSAFTDAKFIASKAQQQDIDELAADHAAGFAKRTPMEAELLKDVTFKSTDIRFDREYTLDLGGVTARLLSWGPTHTRGDTMIWLAEDRVLFTGDVAMKDRFLAFQAYSKGGLWIDILDRLRPFKPQVIVPSHGAMADASLLDEQRSVLQAVQARVRSLKGEGRSVDDVAKVVTTEFQAKHSAWRFTERAGSAARAFYAEEK